MTRISDSTVRRLSLYLRLLRELRRGRVDFVSSHDLASRTGATSAQVRKDLSLFGSFGKRGRGYEVDALAETLEHILGLGGTWRVLVVGVGKIGTALLGYQDMARRGFDVVAALDVSEEKIGSRISGIRVDPFDRLEQVVSETRAQIGIIATPPDAAGNVAELLARAGVSAILNFAPVELSSPLGVPVRTMDVVLELEGLSYLLTTGARNGRSSEEPSLGEDAPVG